MAEFKKAASSVIKHHNFGQNQLSHYANLHLTRCVHNSNRLAQNWQRRPSSASVHTCAAIILPALWQPSAVSRTNKELRRFTAMFDSVFMGLNVADWPEGKKKQKPKLPKVCATLLLTEEKKQMLIFFFCVSCPSSTLSQSSPLSCAALV